jgi:hypothetical protein
MNNHYYKFQNNNKKYRYAKDNKYNDSGRQKQKNTNGVKEDEDLIIEDNTIYEIDRDCVERLRRSRRR